MDDYQKDLLEARYDASREFDRLVAAISSGALTLSIAFMRDPAKISGSHWLRWAWTALVLGLLVSLSSLFASQKAIDRALADYNPSSQTRPKSMGGGWGAATDILTIGSGVAVVVGMGLLAWFGFNRL